MKSRPCGLCETDEPISRHESSGGSWAKPIDCGLFISGGGMAYTSCAPNVHSSHDILKDYLWHAGVNLVEEHNGIMKPARLTDPTSPTEVTAQCEVLGKPVLLYSNFFGLEVGHTVSDTSCLSVPLSLVN